MTILRANSATVKKIMCDKMTARAFTISGVGPSVDACGVSTQPSRQGFLDGGPDFFMRLDSTALTYTPPQASPKKYWAEADLPGSYIEINISDGFPLLICNGNFECVIPNGKGGREINVLLSLGWTIAGAPIDAAFPAANNPHIS